MGIMTVQIHAVITKTDHDALIIAIDLTEKDGYQPTLYAIDLVTGDHAWFTRAECRNKTKDDFRRFAAKAKEVAQLEAAYKATQGQDTKKPEQKPAEQPKLETEIGMDSGQDAEPPSSPPTVIVARVVSPSGSDDLPPEVRAILSGITMAPPRGDEIQPGGLQPVPVNREPMGQKRKRTKKPKKRQRKS